MLGWLRGLGDFFLGLPRGFFGERLDTGWGIVVATYTSIVAISFVIGAVRSVWELSKAVDLRFDKEKLERYNITRPEGSAPRSINWLVARRQQVCSLWFTIPFGAVVMATLFFWVRESFTFKGYVIVGLCWTIGLMLIRPWWITTILRVHRKIVKVGEVSPKDAPLYNKSTMWALRHYFSWGLQQATQKRRAFIGILRWMNPIVSVFRLQWVRVRLIRPLIICTFFASLWLITLPISVFYLNREFEERQNALKPAWAKSHAPEPTYGTGAIRDTPGDAAAAAS